VVTQDESQTDTDRSHEADDCVLSHCCNDGIQWGVPSIRLQIAVLATRMLLNEPRMCTLLKQLHIHLAQYNKIKYIGYIDITNICYHWCKLLPVGKNDSCLCDVLYGELGFAVMTSKTTNCSRQVITFQWF